MVGKRSWYSRRVRNPQLYDCGKRPMVQCFANISAVKYRLCITSIRGCPIFLLIDGSFALILQSRSLYHDEIEN